MFPFSDQQPKPILPILNRPLIARQIDVMRELGLTDGFVVVGHLGYQIAGVLGTGADFGVKLHMVGQEDTLGLAHAVGSLEPLVGGPFLLMLGDIHFHLKAPLRPLVDEVFEGRANASLVSMYEPDPAMVRRNFVIQADESGRVSRVIEKPRYVDSQLKGCGLYVFDQHIFDAIRRTPRTAMRDEYEITTSIQILIDDGYVVKHHPIVERDLNLTKPEDLLVINLLELKRQGLDSVVDPTAVVPAGARVENSVIGARARLLHPIRVTNSVILADVVVDSKTDLDSVVMSGEHSVHCPSVVPTS
jgi:dTDP-glucose pyrophosphorylase